MAADRASDTLILDWRLTAVAEPRQRPIIWLRYFGQALIEIAAAAGEDPAGAGLRLGFAVFYALALAVVLLLYHFVKTPWVRVPMVILLALPRVSIAYGISLSL
ncbi:MAG: hypothetical protein ABI668_00565 [Sphingorhabdus sp.]